MDIFWVVTPCKFVGLYERFIWSFYLRRHPYTLQMEEARSSETLLSTYQITLITPYERS
jgi:hypothetical protein